MASGVIGRYIYIQIPRTIEGRVLSLNEIKEMKSNIDSAFKNRYKLDDASFNSILKYANVYSVYKNGNLIVRIISKHLEDIKRIWGLKNALRKNALSNKRIKQILGLVKHEISLSNRIERLQTMQRLFKYWHIAHLPFAIIMLVIMIIHVGITLAFGARWIF